MLNLKNVSHELPFYQSNTEQGSYIEQHVKNIEIPHKLIRERATRLYKQRSKTFSDYLAVWFDDLADWFEAERQIRQEINNKEQQTTIN